MELYVVVSLCPHIHRLDHLLEFSLETTSQQHFTRTFKCRFFILGFSPASSTCDGWLKFRSLSTGPAMHGKNDKRYTFSIKELLVD